MISSNTPTAMNGTVVFTGVTITTDEDGIHFWGMADKPQFESCYVEKVIAGGPRLFFHEASSQEEEIENPSEWGLTDFLAVRSNKPHEPMIYKEQTEEWEANTSTAETVKAEAWDMAIMLLTLRAVGGTTEEIRHGARASLDLIEDLPESLSKTEHRPVQFDGDQVPWCERCAVDWPCGEGRSKLQIQS